MNCSPNELRSLMQQYVGGSEGRTRSPLNRRFIFTEGVRALANKAGAHWLLDLVATEFAPLVLRRWRAGTTPCYMLELKVADHKAVVELTDSDDAPPVHSRQVSFTDFPEGTWTFELGVDQVVDPPHDSVVLSLLEEH